ncbi:MULTISPECIES: hypothetical protein [unclassified Brevundimonas]|uniref:hypothetical protein n=1 Tax=unclassified Brevundimonas TaxID=2622653 RepID=UPI0025C35036|nr:MULTISPECIES: hypothetical protein [unclassified Brevundimonas]
MIDKSILSALTGEVQGWAVATFGSEARALDALVKATSRRRHIWCAVWSQLTYRGERVDQGGDLNTWRERLVSLKDREILRLAGFQNAHGFQGVLGRLDWMALTDARLYLSIADILSSGGNRAKALRHSREVSARTLEVIQALPDNLCTAHNVEFCAIQRRVPRKELRTLEWRMARLANLDPVLLSNWRRRYQGSPDHGLSMLDELVPFPAPPWRGTDNLVPIDSSEKLGRYSRQYQNCIHHHADSVRRGSSYFYELKDLAIVEFDRVGSLGWEIAYALGPRNSPLTPDAEYQLSQALLMAPANFCRIIPNEE